MTTLLSTSTAFLITTCPRYRSIPQLIQRSQNYILENFPQVAVDSKDILELNVDDFHSIINDDMLNVKVKTFSNPCRDF